MDKWSPEDLCQVGAVCEALGKRDTDSNTTPIFIFWRFLALTRRIRFVFLYRLQLLQTFRPPDTQALACQRGNASWTPAIFHTSDGVPSSAAALAKRLGNQHETQPWT